MPFDQRMEHLGGLHDGGLVFVLCGADGASILMLEDIERAAEAATQLGLELIALH
jgi:hypothetical protein